MDFENIFKKANDKIIVYTEKMKELNSKRDDIILLMETMILQKNKIDELTCEYCNKTFSSKSSCFMR